MMSEEEKKVFYKLKCLCIDVLSDDNLSNYDETSPAERMSMVNSMLNLIAKQQKEIGQIRTELDRKNKMLEQVKKAITYDRMEQLNDYVIYLQTKYLEILGEDNG